MNLNLLGESSWDSGMIVALGLRKSWFDVERTFNMLARSSPSSRMCFLSVICRSPCVIRSRPVRPCSTYDRKS